MIFAGIPTTTELLGMFVVTTAFAPITTLFPIVTFPNTLAPANMITLSPIVGQPAFFPPNTLPIVTPWYMEHE